jgi:hypothetical protein
LCGSGVRGILLRSRNGTPQTKTEICK